MHSSSILCRPHNSITIRLHFPFTSCSTACFYQTVVALILILIRSRASLCLPDWLCSAGDHWVINTAVGSSHSSLSPLCLCLLPMVPGVRYRERQRDRQRKGQRLEEGGEMVRVEKRKGGGGWRRNKKRIRD